jgi:WD40 repeat protein
MLSDSAMKHVADVGSYSGYPSISGDGSRFATYDRTGLVVIHDGVRGKRLKKLPAIGKHGVKALGWDGKGQTLAVGTKDGEVLLFNRAGKQLRKIHATAGRIRKPEVHAVALSTSGRHVAAMREDGAVFVWDASGGHLVAELPVHLSRLLCSKLVFRGEDLVATGGHKKTKEPAGVSIYRLGRANPKKVSKKNAKRKTKTNPQR